MGPTTTTPNIIEFYVKLFAIWLNSTAFQNLPKMQMPAAFASQTYQFAPLNPCQTHGYLPSSIG